MNLAGESLAISLKGVDYKKPTSTNEFLQKQETFKNGKFEIAWQSEGKPEWIGVRCEHREKILTTQVAMLYTLGLLEVTKKKADPIKGQGLSAQKGKLVGSKLKKEKVKA